MCFIRFMIFIHIPSAVGTMAYHPISPSGTRALVPWLLGMLEIDSTHLSLSETCSPKTFMNFYVLFQESVIGYAYLYFLFLFYCLICTLSSV